MRLGTAYALRCDAEVSVNQAMRDLGWLTSTAGPFMLTQSPVFRLLLNSHVFSPFTCSLLRRPSTSKLHLSDPQR